MLLLHVFESATLLLSYIAASQLVGFFFGQCFSNSLKVNFENCDHNISNLHKHMMYQHLHIYYTSELNQ